jgi:hypothetical protein
MRTTGPSLHLRPSRLVWVPPESTPTQSSTPNSTSNQTTTSSSPSPIVPTSTSASADSNRFTPSSLNGENINLIIHWFTTTVHTVVATAGPNAAALTLCQTVILTQAQKRQFLLHGLLAFSALHLADTQTSSSEREHYTNLATAHHDQGLALYHSVLEDVNKENYAASIAFSSLTAMFAFGLYRPGEEAGLGVIDDLSQIFLLAEG